MMFEGMYTVEPKEDCPHIPISIMDLQLQSSLKFYEKCPLCSVQDKENWLCLSCCDVYCSRQVNKHMLYHQEQTNHATALSFSDMSFWCYKCDSQIINKNLNMLKDIYINEKFKDKNILDDSITNNNITNLALSEIHGKLQSNNWTKPVIITSCNEAARPGQTKINANEYKDDEKVLHEKIIILANLIKKSKNLVLYTGAGISTTSGISDYATKAKDSLVKKTNDIEIDYYDCLPTISHKIIYELYKCGQVKQWIQQNHDGLPQKAGFPQNCINEIHGSWYDPSNPVVMMNGSLREDLCESLTYWTDSADMVIAMGTSLSGMTADQIFIKTCNKFKNNESIGGIIIFDKGC